MKLTLDYFNDNYQRYGDIYQLGGKTSPPLIVTSNPQAIKEIFMTPSEQFEIGKNNAGLQFLFGDRSLMFLFISHIDEKIFILKQNNFDQNVF
jgi:hypothetical protein